VRFFSVPRTGGTSVDRKARRFTKAKIAKVCEPGRALHARGLRWRWVVVTLCPAAGMQPRAPRRRGGRMRPGGLALALWAWVFAPTSLTYSQVHDAFGKLVGVAGALRHVS
jgi:hypothetical protein